MPFLGFLDLLLRPELSEADDSLFHDTPRIFVRMS
jgi:hypothetical protein